MKNLAIFTIPKKTMDFFEVAGGFRLDSVLEGTPPRKGEPPARREGCCLFVTYPWGSPPEPDKFCTLRIAPINRDLRDIVDFIDVFPFLNHKAQCTQNKACPLGETMSLRSRFIGACGFPH
ncbi:MAG: hypothetical protein R6T98_00060 [Desulfatiglandales bacterium]